MATKIIYGDRDFDFLEFDADLVQSWSDTNDVTKHKVESGANITDHIRRKSTEYSVTGVISNSPALTEALIAAEPENRAELAYFLLLDQMSDAVTVETPVRTAENMAFDSLGITRDEDTGDALVFQGQFTQITTAQSEVFQAPVTEVLRAQGGKEGGARPTKPADPSWFDKVKESVANWLIF